MARYILRYSGDAAPEEHAGIVTAAPNIKVIDRTPKMILLEGDESDARHLADQLPGWTLHPEVQYKMPNTRKSIGG